jgi:TolB-like protein/Flp pilus assembly protein TadD
MFRTALLYLGGAWAILEFTGFFVDTYGLSARIINVVLLLLALGLPATLIIAWYHGETGPQQVHRAEVSLLVVLMVMAGIGTYRLSTAEEIGRSGGSAVADLGENSVAVLPFANNTGIDSLDWLGPGLSDMVTTNLAQLPGLTVVSPQRLFELLQGEGRQETESIPQQLAMDVASRSGARAMVRGSILTASDEMVVDAQLIDLSDGTILAAERVRGTDAFALADTVARKLSEQILDEPLVTLAEAKRRSPIELTGNMVEYRQFQEDLRTNWADFGKDSIEARRRVAGMLEMMPGREDEAKLVLTQILAVDPDDPRALSQLARIAVSQGDSLLADSLIQRFVVVAPDRLQAMEVGGRIYAEGGRYDKARDVFRATLSEAPEEVIALDHLTRAWLLDHSPEDARRDLEAPANSDNAMIRAEAQLLLGDTYAWEGRFDDAFLRYQAAGEIGRESGSVENEARARESRIFLESALGESPRVGRLNPSMWRLIEVGRAEAALKVVEAAERMNVEDADRIIPVDYYFLLYARGRVLEQLGEPRGALRAYDELMASWGHIIEALPRIADTPERIAALR